MGRGEVCVMARCEWKIRDFGKVWSGSLNEADFRQKKLQTSHARANG